MQVLKSEDEEGVATVTITFGDDDHKFELWKDGDTAYVEYQETLSWRGQIRVSDPDEEIYKALMVSDEVTDFLAEHDCKRVQRADPKA